MNYIEIVSEIIALMIYIAIGYIIRKLKLITENGIHDISRIIVNVAMPTLLFSSMLIDYKTEYIKNMGIIALMAMLYLIFTSVTSKQLAWRLTEKDSERKSIRYSMIFGNIAFLAFPLCEALFGKLGVFYASIFVIVQNIFQWTVGVNIFKQEKIRLSNLKNLISPGIVAIISGLICFSLNIKPPAILDKVIKGISGISIPLALMMTGAQLYGYKIGDIIANRKVQIITLVKTLAFPVIFLAIVYYIPIDNMLTYIVAIQAAGPVQASATAFSRNFNGDPTIVAKVVFLSTLCCLVTIPLFVMLVNL